MRLWILASLLAGVIPLLAADDDNTPTFHSDVSVGRIDALVLDHSQQPIVGLLKEDFVLRQDGKPVPIREVGYEDLPVDVLLLLDVSGSMQVHIQRVASAAHEAMSVLGNQDRVGIMVFDTRTRVRLPFRQNLNEVERKLDDVVRSESFRGGTNINGALMDAAAYMDREERRQARHAIIIVTDDQAEPCNQARVLAALDKADAVLMVLLAPAWEGPYSQEPFPGGGRRGGPMSSPFPGVGGIPGLGGVILGPRSAPTTPGTPNLNAGRIAGSPDIARASGGDSLSVNDGSAVQSILERIRQRYTVYFHLPEDMDAKRGLQLDLTDAARRRHPDATLQYRQIGLATDSGRPGLISRVAAHPPTGDDGASAQTDSANADSSVTPHRRPGVSDSSGTQVNLPVQAPASTDAATPQPTVNHHRAISDPGSGPVVNSGPAH